MIYKNTMIIGNKTAHTGHPYRPKAYGAAELVAREPEMRSITAAWMAGPGTLPMSPLLLGEPGVGKNRIVYELARQTGKDLYIFQGHEDVTAEDLACAVRFSDNPDRKMDYVLSPLVTAMALGQICFIDEIAKIRPRALALLVSVLDERRYIDSPFWAKGSMPKRVFVLLPLPILPIWRAILCLSLSGSVCVRSSGWNIRCPKLLTVLSKTIFLIWVIQPRPSRMFSGSCGMTGIPGSPLRPEMPYRFLISPLA
ncbi:MAG: AAA family ATPase [Bacteroidales bacterium]